MEETILKKLIGFRRELHAYPEVSQDEKNTQRLIRAFLESIGLDQIIEIGFTGLLCVIDSKVEGPVVLIRGDIDALPIEEINTFDHKSKNEGVSHKCGHDGHAAILCGLAKTLKDNLPVRGKVILLFQPAEENGEGAKAVLADENFKYRPDFVFALHNLPGYPLHEIVYRNGSFTAAAKSIIIKLVGKTAHAAEPELGSNPAQAISKIIQAFEALANRDLKSADFALTTPIHINMGELAYGVSAGKGEVHYTLRSWDNSIMNKLAYACESKARAIAKEENLEIEISWTQEFAANQNHPDAVLHVIHAADQSGFNLTQRPYPFKWGEDFGLFTEKYKGAMFGIGSGEKCPALHNPDYDFPDEIIPTGVKMFSSIIHQILK